MAELIYKGTRELENKRCLLWIRSVFLLNGSPSVLTNKQTNKQTNKLHGVSPRANYTDRATAACRRSDCELLWIKGATWSA
jgi:hypothetical protein